jgi:hypothetical protein
MVAFCYSTKFTVCCVYILTLQMNYLFSVLLFGDWLPLSVDVCTSILRRISLLCTDSNLIQATTAAYLEIDQITLVRTWASCFFYCYGYSHPYNTLMKNASCILFSGIWSLRGCLPVYNMTSIFFWNYRKSQALWQKLTIKRASPPVIYSCCQEVGELWTIKGANTFNRIYFDREFWVIWILAYGFSYNRPSPRACLEPCESVDSGDQSVDLQQQQQFFYLNQVIFSNFPIVW